MKKHKIQIKACTRSINKPGYECIKARDLPQKGEWYLNDDGEVILSAFDFEKSKYPILRKIKDPKGWKFLESLGNRALIEYKGATYLYEYDGGRITLSNSNFTYKTSKNSKDEFIAGITRSTCKILYQED
jgi:hypothetical protein